MLLNYFRTLVWFQLKSLIFQKPFWHISDTPHFVHAMA